MAPRMRVISDNDYSGDPDGLFQLAHLLLSPSVDVRAVIGSHLHEGDPFDSSGRSATNARAAADIVVDLLGLTGRVRTLEGSNTGLPDRPTPDRSPGAEAIVAEAMTEADTPLLVTLGAGLTELASAYLLEPRIADRLTAVWIGEPEDSAWRSCRRASRAPRCRNTTCASTSPPRKSSLRLPSRCGRFPATPTARRW
jgi:purine nucleosidase